jgi:hypothetical protein
MAFARKLNLKVVTLPHSWGNFWLCDLFFGDIRLYDINPPAFIGLIKNSEYVFTDSFHGAAFASIYHKNFFVYKRELRNRSLDTLGWDTRVHSLLEILETPDRLLSGKETMEDILSLKEIKYGAVAQKMDKWRKDSIRYLEDALATAKNPQSSNPPPTK